MGDAYPAIRTNREMIEQSILAEEHRFEAVLTEGLPRLEAELAKVLGTKSRVLGGDAAFKLYDTFGIPFDFIEDTATTQGVAVDKAGYERAMEGQRGKARGRRLQGRDEPAWSSRIAPKSTPSTTRFGATTQRSQWACRSPSSTTTSRR
jgi:alanyl-tRNA synthetase